MQTQDTAQYDRAAEFGAKDGLLDVTRSGDEIVIRTGAGVISRTQRNIRIACLLAALGGLGLLVVSMWGLAVAALASAAMYLAPKLIRQTPLLRIDTISRTASALHAGAGSKDIDLADVTSISGIYETQGWDPRIVIYFVRREGGREEAVIFPGANEAAARRCCGVVAQLLGIPATYTNQYDATVSC